jgi:hypothetical protein
VNTPDESPLDQTDQAILERLATIHGRVDPPPADLDDRVRFAIALDQLDVELARLRTDLMTAAHRGSDRTRTITFEADSRTVMITIVEQPNGSIRIDGWLAPPAATRIELRLPEPAPPMAVNSDDTGRFVFNLVPRGLAQLLVHPPAEETTPRIVTPVLAL